MSQVPQAQRIAEHLQKVYGTDGEHLWAKYPAYTVFRHPHSRKWYGIIMEVPKSRLGFHEDCVVPVLDVKCDPLLIGSLLMEKGILPAYHMNKTTWISILLDETVADDMIFSLLDMSYDSAGPKQKKKPPKSRA